MTSLTSAPTPSQMAAIALTYESFVARKALAAYLIVSADAGSVTMTGAATLAYSDATRIAADSSVDPTTIRSGCRKSLHGRALTEELGIRHHPDVGARQDPFDHPSGADGHGRLVDDDALVGQVRPDLASSVLDVAEIGAAVVALRRRHAQEHHVGIGHGVGRAEHERQTTAPDALLDQPFEAVLDDGHLTPLQQLDLGGVDVGADDVVAQVSETSAGRQSDVPGADDGDA